VKGEDTQQGEDERQHYSAHRHAPFEFGDAVLQSGLAVVVRGERDDFPEATTDPAHRRGPRDLQLREEVRISRADDLLLDAVVIGAPIAMGCPSSVPIGDNQLGSSSRGRLPGRTHPPVTGLASDKAGARTVAPRGPWSSPRPSLQTTGARRSRGMRAPPCSPFRKHRMKERESSREYGRDRRRFRWRRCRACLPEDPDARVRALVFALLVVPVSPSSLAIMGLHEGSPTCHVLRLDEAYDQPGNAYLFAKKVIERLRGAPIRLNRADGAVGAAPEQS
jgi:hypothetical protein